MKLLLLAFFALWFGIIMWGIGGNAAPRPAAVKIGALLTYNSSIGRVAKFAIDAAVNDINSDAKVLQGTKLIVQMQDTECSGPAGVTQALEFMNTDVVAVIGPQSSVIAHVVSHVANVLQVPLLSFAATDPTLSSLQYPFLVPTAQSDTFQMEAIAGIIYQFQWKQVTAIFSDDDYGRNGVASLGDKLMEKGSKITNKAVLPQEATISDVMDVLIKVSLMESRIIVLHVYGDTGLRVLSVAHYLGMMTSGYVWIATDWLSSMLDSSSLDSNTKETLQGVLALRQHTVDSRNKRTFVSSWSELTKNETGGNIQLNSYGLYAYDTVWMIAHALDAFFDNNGTISFSNYSKEGTTHLKQMAVFDGGKLLLKNILAANFVGLTGPVQFGSDGYLIQSAYDILNVIGTGFRTVGYWSNYSGLSVLTPESLYSMQANVSTVTQQLYSIIWPGGTSAKPRGWVFPNNGKELRIGVPNRVSYQEFVSIDVTTGVAKGYCIDVFTAALSLLPYAVPYRFIAYGDGVRSPSYDELVKMVATNNFDAAVGDITIVRNRTKIVDFTQPYIGSGLVILVPLLDHNKVAWAFLQPFTPQMWFVTVLSFLIVGAVVWFLEHRINDEFRGPKKKQLCTIFWFSFSTLFFSQKESTVSTLGRAVVIIWLFAVLIIQSSYTASLTSILTVQQLYSPIKGIDSLISSNDPIGYQVGSFAANYLADVIGIRRSRLKALDSRDQYEHALVLGPNNGGVAAIVDERPYVELFLASQCKFSIVGNEFTKSDWGFVFQKDFPLAVDLSAALLRLSEDGDLRRIHEQWLSRGSCSSENNNFKSGRLRLQSFVGLFFIIGLACVVSLLIYFFLMLRQFIRHPPAAEPDTSREGSTRRRIQSFFSFADDKVEDVMNRSRIKIENTTMSNNNIER